MSFTVEATSKGSRSKWPSSWVRVTHPCRRSPCPRSLSSLPPAALIPTPGPRDMGAQPGSLPWEPSGSRELLWARGLPCQDWPCRGGRGAAPPPPWGHRPPSAWGPAWEGNASGAGQDRSCSSPGTCRGVPPRAAVGSRWMPARCPQRPGSPPCPGPSVPPPHGCAGSPPGCCGDASRACPLASCLLVLPTGRDPENNQEALENFQKFVKAKGLNQDILEPTQSGRKEGSPAGPAQLPPPRPPQQWDHQLMLSENTRHLTVALLSPGLADTLAGEGPGVLTRPPGSPGSCASPFFPQKLALQEKTRVSGQWPGTHAKMALEPVGSWEACGLPPTLDPTWARQAQPPAQGASPASAS